MTENVKINELIHQGALIKTDDAVAVGIVSDLTRRRQFNQWDAPAGFQINHLNDEAGDRARNDPRRCIRKSEIQERSHQHDFLHIARQLV